MRELVVLSDGDTDWLFDGLGSDSQRLRVEALSTRPCLADQIAAANRCLRGGARVAACMKANVSLAAERSAEDLIESLGDLEQRPEPAVLAITRQAEDGVDACGLPERLSVDMWAFSRPLDVPPRADARQMVAALTCAGCALHDLSLDIAITCHGPAFDDRQEAAADTGPGHVLPRQRRDWLRAGYRPAPVPVGASDMAGRFIVAVPKGTERRLAADLDRILVLAKRHDLALLILCDGNEEQILAENAARLADAPWAALTFPRSGALAARPAFLAAQQQMTHRIAFVSDVGRISEPLIRETGGSIFLTLRERPAPLVPVDFGCTLVTSVFRAEPFMAGFLNNCRALQGYGEQIEHVFLVSVLSEREQVLLSELLDRFPSVTVLWYRKDPGLYECWNTGIRVAQTPYVSNANVDDLRDPAHVATLVADLESHPEIKVAATALNPFYDFPEDGTLPEDRPGWYADRAGPFGFFDLATLSEGETPGLVPFNMPHCMPVWRRSLHDEFGWFDEGRYGTYADWAYWLRCLQSGGQGWINPAPLGFYFVNPTSHNRRGTDLERLHKVVEDDFLPFFLARRKDASTRPAVVIPEVPRKLKLRGRELAYGQHRNSFSRLVEALAPLETETGDGVLFIPFLERQFVWGDADGEAASANPRPITKPWIGILHVPFEAPAWFDTAVSPEVFMATPLFQASRPFCRGIITLAQDLEADLKTFDPSVPTLSVKHPTAFDAALFDPAAYRADPKVVQVGDWLRRLQAIHRLRAPGHQRIMLLKQWTRVFMDREIAVFGDARDPAVEMVDYVSNERYDELLRSSVVLCLLYGTAANNVVIECIARATPILINPLPAVVEYLGRGYPLYARDEAQADTLLATPGLVDAAHEYLLRRRADIDLSYEGFCRDIAASGLYARL
ncbi:MAG: hypothetical protein Kow0013_28130 [Pararhodobacter sp.]